MTNGRLGRQQDKEAQYSPYITEPLTQWCAIVVLS